MKNTTLTEEQVKSRLGYFTASDIYQLMKPKGIGKGGETYIIEKATEVFTGEKCKNTFSSAATQWGIDHELEAQLYFEAASGLKIKKEDTLSCEDSFGTTYFKYTPDGKIIELDFGFEIKCPYNSGNHTKALLLENQEDLLKFNEKWFWQIYAGLYGSKAKGWKFCSYDPRFEKDEMKMFILNILPQNEYLDFFEKRITEAKLIFDNIIVKLNK